MATGTYSCPRQVWVVPLTRPLPYRSRRVRSKARITSMRERSASITA
ncbi:hypothetical protein [Nonomuraea dietziae]